MGEVLNLDFTNLGNQRLSTFQTIKSMATPVLFSYFADVNKFVVLIQPENLLPLTYGLFLVSVESESDSFVDQISVVGLAEFHDHISSGIEDEDLFTDLFDRNRCLEGSVLQRRFPSLS